MDTGLLDTHAKCSTEYHSKKMYSDVNEGVICVYVINGNDTEKKKDVFDQLKSLQIADRIIWKWDADTLRGIYGPRNKDRYK